ncbi:MAG: hypothetical protein HC926_03565 [Synechococcaceae cyanobacterium SM2_3_60]|nr:hypothetical protein [Synechococcaceae cyanobacterium SM2_3_60]
MLDIPIWPRALIRRVHTGTQTKKTRLQRWQNMKMVFEVHPSVSVEGKRVVLVDDIITTGATTVLCAESLWLPGQR